MAMEDTTGAAGSSSSSGLPPEITMPPPSPRRGQKRGAPDEDDDAACDGAARGSPPRRRAGVETLAEEYYYMEFVDDDEEGELGEAADDAHAPPAPQLFEFLRVHPGAADDDAGGAAAGQEPVDVTLRLGVGPVAGEYRGGTVDATLTLRLVSAAALDEDDGGLRFQSHDKTATGAALGAASNVEPDFDEGPTLELHYTPAASFHEPASDDEEEEGFFPAAGFAATAGDGSVGSAEDDDAADRPSSVLDLNQPGPGSSDSELPDGAPDPSDVPAPDTAVLDDDDLAAHVDERGVATATAAEQHSGSSTPFVFFCSPVHDVRAPGVLTADSS